MAGYGYGYVPERAYTAFLRELSEGAWKNVAIDKYNAPDQKPEKHLFEAPRPVVWKLRATWTIGMLIDALGFGSAEQLAALDAEWDAAQNELAAGIAMADASRDPDKRAAAARLRPLILVGSTGTAQTGYGYDDEFDFGHHQLLVTSKGEPAADLKKVGLEATMARIREATDAFGKGLGRGPGQKRAARRSQRVREALQACTAAFNGIHDEMAWLIEHTPEGEVKRRIEELHAPFLGLLERNPPPEAKKSDDGAAEGEAKKGAAESAPKAKEEAAKNG